MKQGGSKWKKPSIPNYNPQVPKPGQVSREAVKAYRSQMQAKTDAGSHNLRKSQ